MRVRREPRELYTGRMLESDMFGDARFMLDPLFVAHYRALARRDGYVTFRDAVQLVRDHYPGNPTNPRRDIPRELRLAVCEQLRLPMEEWDDIKVYSSVGSPLDRIHGVDAFVIYEPANESPRIVTLDVTQRPEKLEEGHRADVIIGEFVDPQDDEAQYSEQMMRAANNVVSRLKAQQERPNAYHT